MTREHRYNWCPGSRATTALHNLRRPAMQNHETAGARQFHDATKYVRVQAGEPDEDIVIGAPNLLGPSMEEQDPADQPLPYKIYTSLDPLELPRAFQPFTMPALDAI